MPHTIKIEVDAYLLFAVLFGVLIIIGLVIYAVTTYHTYITVTITEYENNLVGALGCVPCKTPTLLKYVSLLLNGTFLIGGNMDSSIMMTFALNGTYYITGEFYLRPPVYICIAPEATAGFMALAVWNNTFTPSNGYGYIKCVNGDGPAWLNVTLGPGTYAIVVAVYGPNKPSKPINITVLRPLTGTLINNIVFYPQCRYASPNVVPPNVPREKPQPIPFQNEIFAVQ